MSTTPNDQAAEVRRRRRRWIIIGVVIALVVIAVAVGLTSLWIYYFVSEAPPAPTIDDALRELLPSSPPE